MKIFYLVKVKRITFIEFGDGLNARFYLKGLYKDMNVKGKYGAIKLLEHNNWQIYETNTDGKLYGLLD